MRQADTYYKPAAFWKVADRGQSGRAQCLLCPFNCILAEGKVGICRGKRNVDGRLWAINYGRTTSVNIDPIEKKPLYHFYPGSEILSIGPNGCNLKCNFCQNYYVSQGDSPTRYVEPDEVAKLAEDNRAVGVAYTYSEPLIWYEYVMDCARAIHSARLKNVLVTNGLINPEPLAELLPWIDAMNIDIKSMDPGFYKKICKGMLEPVLETVREAAKSTHVEITNLIIPGLNDTDEQFEKLTDFVASVSDMIPLHFSRYHPDYQQTAPHTPMDTLERAYLIAASKLKFVYIGNVLSNGMNQTKCPHCGQIIIRRAGYLVTDLSVLHGKCKNCGNFTGITN